MTSGRTLDEFIAELEPQLAPLVPREIATVLDSDALTKTEVAAYLLEARCLLHRLPKRAGIAAG